MKKNMLFVTIIVGIIVMFGVLIDRQVEYHAYFQSIEKKCEIEIEDDIPFENIRRKTPERSGLFEYTYRIYWNDEDGRLYYTENTVTLLDMLEKAFSKA